MSKPKKPRRRKNKDSRHRSGKGLTAAKPTPQHNVKIELPPVEPRIDRPPLVKAGRLWHVVSTTLRCEEKAEKALQALGFDTYRPFVPEKVVRRGRVVDTVRYIIPRYLFVAFDPGTADEPGEHWYPILHTDGVDGMLRSRSTFMPLPIPDGALTRLIEEAEKYLADSPQPFGKGDEVKILEGMFAMFSGKIEAMTKETVKVGVSMMGKPATIELPLKSVQAA